MQDGAGLSTRRNMVVKEFLVFQTQKKTGVAVSSTKIPDVVVLRKRKDCSSIKHWLKFLIFVNFLRLFLGSLARSGLTQSFCETVYLCKKRVDKEAQNFSELFLAWSCMHRGLGTCGFLESNCEMW